MDREKGALMDEIEKTLWSLTEVHLQYLCQQHGRDVSGVRGMDHRSLRRKLMEEMWDNTDSMKSEEQGMSWLLQLKKEIRRILEDGSVKPLSPCQSNKDQGRAEARDADNEWKEEGGVELPSTRPEAEPVSPSQSEGETTDCDMEDSDWLPSNGLGATLKSPSQSNDTGDTAEDEEWDREVRDWMASDQVEAEFSPNRDTPGQRDGCPMPPAAQQKTLGCGCSESASLHGLRGVSVQLTDCRKTLGLETHKTTHSCSRCWKRFATGDILERHLLNHTEGKQNNVCSKCGKVFSTYSTLTRHLKTHISEKTHGSNTTCSECGKTFSTYASVKRHLLTHTGEKPYICPNCGKSFNDRGNLKKHILRTHAGGNSGNTLLENNVGSSEQDEAVKKPVRYPCSHCGKRLSTKTRLKLHLKIHTVEKPYICPDCGKCFAFRPSLTKHQKLSHSEHIGVKCHPCSLCGKVFNQPGFLKTHQRIHTGEKPHLCSECGKRFSFHSSMRRHQALHMGDNVKTLVCTVCGKGFRSSGYLKKHQAVHSEEKSHLCSDCGKTFASLFTLTLHSKTHHIDGDQFQCSDCQRQFPTKGRLRSHQRTHTGEKPFHCSQCHKRFSHSNSYQRHLRMHSGEKPFVCPLCGKQFNDSSNLRTHVRRHNGEKYKSQISEPCPHCGKRLASKVGLETHLRTHTGEKPHLCADCGKSFTFHSALRRHQKTQHVEQVAKPHVCSVCGKGFKESGALKKHVLTHEEKQHLCSDCGKSFRLLQALLNHQRNKHQKTSGDNEQIREINPFCCNICRQEFSSKHRLVIHERKHSGEKPYQCSNCDRRFADKTNMRRHQTVHTGEKPFKCVICDMRFSQAASLIRHRLIHSGEKPHHCTYCDKRFSQSNTLKTHILTHTGEKPYQCTDCGKRFTEKKAMKKHQRETHGTGPHGRLHVSEVPNPVLDKITLLDQDGQAGDASFQCPDRGGVFPEKGNLQKPQKTHRVNVAPYWSGVLQQCSQEPQKSPTDSDSDQDWTSL